MEFVYGFHKFQRVYFWNLWEDCFHYGVHGSRWLMLALAHDGIYLMITLISTILYPILCVDIIHCRMVATNYVALGMIVLALTSTLGDHTIGVCQYVLA